MIKTLHRYKKLIKIVFWLWLLFIAIVSTLPNIPTQKINIWDQPFRLDYLEHFGVFAILLGLFVIWKSDEHAHFNVRAELLFLVGLFVFAIADEIHQIWIPGRSYNPLDLIYNVLGFIAGLYITKFVLQKIAVKEIDKQ